VFSSNKKKLENFDSQHQPSLQTETKRIESQCQRLMD
jgi:hypothetical protein